MSPHSGDSVAFEDLRPSAADAAALAFVGSPERVQSPPSARTGTARGLATLDRDAMHRRTLAAADVTAAALAMIISIAAGGADHPKLGIFAAVPLIVVMSKVMGIYDREELLVRRSTLDEAPVLFQLATLYALIVWLIEGLVLAGPSDRRELLALWFALFVLLFIGRAVARRLSRRLTLAERCLVIGDGPTFRRVESTLASRRSLHARVVAQVPLDGLSKGDDLAALVVRYRIDRIIMTPRSADGDDVLNVVRAATALEIKVSVVPRLLEVIGSSVEFDDLDGVPLLCVRRPGLHRSSRFLKRTLDLCGSVLGLVVFSPLLGLTALVIKLDSHGTVFFRQLRIGRDGEPFEMLKLRTMVDGADEQKDTLRHLNQAVGLFKIAQDPRITRVGKALRRTSLDELPQLWNVLRGDMSLVGPRPLVLEEDLQIEGWNRRRLRLTPGMTGHWQILGSARIPLDEMVKIDYLYMTNWSLWLDVRILLRTIPYVLTRRGM